ncbi:hypothetical protein B0T14DRAFT_83663 [Immersiella caudata]|uniref:Uncharacterized protein n=1 Tax=Immersiella caudata TaxID=314043 RepID=A0AA40CCZ2_9PEZI|nr:hypothetical protein B0T14DRAFT_83663 [Immersiella caudata]
MATLETAVGMIAPSNNKSFVYFKLKAAPFEGWVSACDIDHFEGKRMSKDLTSSHIHYASLLGLDFVIEAFFGSRQGISFDPTLPTPTSLFDMVNKWSGQCGNALQAASYTGHETTVQTPLSKGAGVNTSLPDELVGMRYK